MQNFEMPQLEMLKLKQEIEKISAKPPAAVD